MLKEILDLVSAAKKITGEEKPIRKIELSLQGYIELAWEISNQPFIAYNGTDIIASGMLIYEGLEVTVTEGCMWDNPLEPETINAFPKLDSDVCLKDMLEAAKELKKFVNKHSKRSI